MSSVSGVGGGINVGDMKNLDLESAMMLVQTKRAELLESQLVGRIKDLDSKNKQIATLNQMMAEVRGNRPTNADGSKADGKATFGPKPENQARSNEIMAAMREAGVEGMPGDWKKDNEYEVRLKDGTKLKVDEAGKREAETCVAYYWAFRSGDYSGAKEVKEIKATGNKIDVNKPEMTQAQYDTMVEKLKGAIESLNSTQQMDMLKVQSLSNKRNEAFDIMTNFIKKMQDNRSSIIGNLR